MLSMMIYLEVFNIESIKEEIAIRIDSLEIKNISKQKIIDETIAEIENYFIDFMEKEYGSYKHITKLENFEYSFLSDMYKGICYINSFKSYEYEDMSSKEFRRIAKHILQQVKIKDKKLNDDLIEKISQNETANLRKYKQLKYKENKVGYTNYIKKIKDNELKVLKKSKEEETNKRYKEESEREIESSKNKYIGKGTDDFFAKLLENKESNQQEAELPIKKSKKWSFIGLFRNRFK